MKKKKLYDYTLRKPSEQELTELKEYLLDESGQFDRFYCDDLEQVEKIIKTYFYGVIENYTSDTPGYCGKLLFCVYGLPEFYEVYCWRNKKIVRLEQDEQFKIKVV